MPNPKKATRRSKKNGAPSMTVAQLREGLGLTQQEFATLLGLSTVSVSRWEHKHTKPTDSSGALLKLLARAFHQSGPEKVVKTLRDLTGSAEDERLIALVHLGD